MKCTTPLLALATAILLISGCGRTAGGNGASAATTAPTAAEASTRADDQYFDFSIDGEPMHIRVADIYVTLGYGGTLKVYAGAERQMSIALTIPNIASCPCVVPAGSTDPANELGQGSLSLQHYPKPGNTLNNWYVGLEATPATDAIEITDIGTIVDGARYVSGSFHTTVLKTESNGDGPENHDYVISDGRFRLRFETTGVNGF